jgi:hypothetical protein
MSLDPVSIAISPLDDLECPVNRRTLPEVLSLLESVDTVELPAERTRIEPPDDNVPD